MNRNVTRAEQLTDMIRRLRAVQEEEALRSTLIEAIDLYIQIHESDPQAQAAEANYQGKINEVKNALQEIRNRREAMTLQAIKTATLMALENLQEWVMRAPSGGKRKRKTRSRKHKRSRKSRRVHRKN